jgi:hypothetical protein
MDNYAHTMGVFNALMNREEFHAAVEWRAFARHAPIVTFFVIAAWALDVTSALGYALLLWIILRVLRRPLWGFGFHHTHLWTWLYFVRLMFFRWPMAVLCTLIFWWRNPVVFGLVWPWFIGLFLFDLLSTLFREAKGHTQARLMILALEQEQDRMLNP